MLRQRQHLRPVRWLLLGLCWFVLGSYASFQSGLVTALVPETCCCAGEGDGDEDGDRCPPDCGDGTCCPGQALVLASPHSVSTVASIARQSPRVAPPEPTRQGFCGQVFRPPRLLSV